MNNMANKQSTTLSSMRKITELFHEADTNDKGYLTREDFKFAMIVLFGYKPSKYEVDRLMPNSNEMNLSDFMKIRIDLIALVFLKPGSILYIRL